jgi:hypothetical protein
MYYRNIICIIISLTVCSIVIFVPVGIVIGKYAISAASNGSPKILQTNSPTTSVTPQPSPSVDVTSSPSEFINHQQPNSTITPTRSISPAIPSSSSTNKPSTFRPSTSQPTIACPCPFSRRGNGVCDALCSTAVCNWDCATRNGILKCDCNPVGCPSTCRTGVRFVY